MARWKYIWPVSCALLGVLVAKKDLPGSLSGLSAFAFLSAGGIVGGSIGTAILGISRGRTRNRRLLSWTLAAALLGGVVGLYDREILRPVLFGLCGGASGLFIGICIDRLATREATNRAKLVAFAVAAGAIALVIVYVAHNWIEASR